VPHPIAILSASPAKESCEWNFQHGWIKSSSS
jgi:hypothetical protein